MLVSATGRRASGARAAVLSHNGMIRTTLRPHWHRDTNELHLFQIEIKYYKVGATSSWQAIVTLLRN